MKKNNVVLHQYSFWLICSGTAWYLLSRWWSKFLSRQLAKPTGSFGESAIPALYKTLNQDAIVWACDKVSEYIEHDCQILDIGCGSGLAFRPLLRILDAAREEKYQSFDRRNLGRASSATCKVLGIDMSSAILESCREEFKEELASGLVEIREQNFLHQNIKETFNLILAFNVIHLTMDKRETIKTWCNMLRKDGVIALLFRCSPEYSRETEVQAGIKQGIYELPTKKELMDIMLIDCSMLEVKIRCIDELSMNSEIKDFYLITAKAPGNRTSRHVEIEYTD